MIKDDIINELQYIPESKLQALYELIHYFRLGINSEIVPESSEDEDIKIDKDQCLRTLQKIKQGDLSSFTEIGDIKTYIQDLKDEIS
ncbi:hypothetical protein FJR38_15720 [Anabaena sp. UHCC 0253]|uniref:hypothetical protein n=1 Tax=Anabaena sp. UHCC 0253 TaxID=2590019 RepID=UPI001446BC51|nr:hypothetical protein [Anabaena sp. UHCC 0253]MTJ53989.1 hypothetical protein [Anabaena sp. UHCC 0253]